MATLQAIAAAEVEEWLAWAPGKYLDPDLFAGYQCKDVPDAYAMALFGRPLFATLAAGDAETVLDGAHPDYWTTVRYRPGLLPPRGSVLCYGGTADGGLNPYGHTAVTLAATPAAIRVLQQDGFLQVAAHVAELGYTGPGTGPLLGWLIPRPERVVDTGALGRLAGTLAPQSTPQEAPTVAKSYELVTSYTTVNKVARSFYGFPSKPTGITLHHWGNDGQRFPDVAHFLSTNTVPTSAHYVVEDGRIACLAVPEVATYHAGSTPGNGSTIGIEMRPEMTKGDKDTLVQLVYELERAYGGLTIYLHQEWFATACPGRYVRFREELIERVNAMHRNGGKDPGLEAKPATVVDKVAAAAKLKPKPKPAAKPAPKRPDLYGQTVADPIGGRVGPWHEVWPFRINAIYRALDKANERITKLEAELGTTTPTK